MRSLAARLFAPFLVALIAPFGMTSTGAAAPSSDLWERWAAHDPSSVAAVDHGLWQTVLDSVNMRGTDGIRRIAYNRLAGARLAQLRRYIASLETVPVSTLNRDEQFAYWVNLYNALTLRVIAENYPVESIRDIDISPGLFADGPWGAELATVEGQAITLDDIEHRILRPIWQDPRVHYAVNCASVGCPDLAPEAFTGAQLDGQLTAAAFRFINHSRGATVRDGRLIASKIYTWFEEDFGGSEAGVIAHLSQYAHGQLATALKTIDDIHDYEYDWTLNDIAKDGAGPATVRVRRRFGS